METIFSCDDCFGVHGQQDSNNANYCQDESYRKSRVSEIAELAGTRPATVSNWARRFAADFPEGRRDGRRVLYDRAEIVDWLERHRPDYGATRTAGAQAVDAIRAVARSDAWSRSRAGAAVPDIAGSSRGR